MGRWPAAQGKRHHDCTHAHSRKQRPQPRPAHTEGDMARSCLAPVEPRLAPLKVAIGQPQNKVNQSAGVVALMHRLNGTLKRLEPRMIGHVLMPTANSHALAC